MIRCALVELVLPGGGYALGGRLRWAALDLLVLAGLLLACLVTPWAIWAIVLARVVAALDAGRRGRRGPPADGWGWSAMGLCGAVGLGLTLLSRLVVVEAFKIPTVSMTPTLALDDKIVVDKLSMRWRGPARGEIVAFWLGERTYVKRVIAVGGDRVAVRHGVVHVNGVATPRRRLGPTTYLDRPAPGRATRVEAALAFEERYAGRVYHVFSSDDGGDGAPWYAHDYPDDERGALACGDEPYPDVGTRRLAPDGDGACRVPAGTVFVLGDNRTNSADSRVWGAVPVERVFGRVVGVWLGGRDWLGRIGRVE